MRSPPTSDETFYERHTVLLTVAGMAVVHALSPRRVRMLLLPVRPSARRVLFDAASHAALWFALHHWFLPWSRRMTAERERVRGEMTTSLGRVPTDDEVTERLMADFRREHARSRPTGR